MSKPFGLAVYVSVFEQQRPLLEKLKGQNYPIFTSLHISEEVSKTYVEDIQKMCDWLYENDFYIMADVSPYTLERFQEPTLSSLVRRLHINNLRLDFGFNDQSLGDDLKKVAVTYNASTILGETENSSEATYMHNFYPRPETGLDSELFDHLNKLIKEIGGKTLAFISGDKAKRGPIYEGLPTLEDHRYAAPYAQYIDLIRKYKMDAVYVGDPLVTEQQLNLILSYLEDGLLRLPVDFVDEHTALYYQPFTVRVDSPKTLIRIQESREFAQEGRAIAPKNTIERTFGMITMDNERYKRYSGEVQVLKTNFPADERVNVIGQLPEEYFLLLDNIKNGERFMFVPAE